MTKEVLNKYSKYVKRKLEEYVEFKINWCYATAIKDNLAMVEFSISEIETDEYIKEDFLQMIEHNFKETGYFDKMRIVFGKDSFIVIKTAKEIYWSEIQAFSDAGLFMIEILNGKIDD